MKLQTILKYLAYGLGVIGAILSLLIMVSDSEGYIDFILYITYIIMFIILALIITFVIKGLLAGNIKKTLLPIVLFLGIILVSYLISSGTDLNLDQFNAKGMGVTESTSKSVGAGLYAFYLLAIIAVGTIVYSTIKGSLTKK